MSNLSKKIFSSGIQAIATQLLGGIFFYMTSLYLSKVDFAILGWANAIALTIILFLSFGLEPIVIRKIASNNASGWVTSVYFLHNIVFSILALITLILVGLFTVGKIDLRILPWLFISQAFIFIALPLKQSLNAREKFAPYAIVSLSSNLFKIILALILSYFRKITLNNVVIIFVATSFFEFISIFLYVKVYQQFSLFFRRRAYFSLIKVSFPQYVSVLFDALLGRIDWIILGFVSTKIALADYSFAYKMYELSRLPIFIISPLLLTKFSRAAGKRYLDENRKKDIQYLFTMEMFIAVLLPLCLNIVWGTLVDAITDNKYGSTNNYCFFILSSCITINFAINFMWTSLIALKRYKVISVALAISTIFNLILNIILIPQYNKIGAAYSYLFAMLGQATIFYFYFRKTIFNVSIKSFFIFISYAICAYFCSKWITDNVLMELFCCVFIYSILCVLTGQIKLIHLRWLKELFRTN